MIVEAPSRQPPRGQSRLASGLEVLAGTVLGIVLSIALQRLLFPAMGHGFTLDQNLAIALAFTALSLVRGYAVRRFFNRLRREVA